jgi:hypothetical protein
MDQYKVLFEVSLSHNFYLGSFSKDYEIVMSSSIRTMMKSYQLLFKKKADGFIILGKSAQLFLISSSKKAIKFRFGIQVKNRYFENFSKIRPQEPYMKYLFRNEVYQESADGQLEIQEVILHSDNYLSETNFNFCLQGNFQPTKVWGNELTISDENGNYFEGEIEENTQLGQLLIDDFGSYKVKSSHATKEDEIFYVEPDLKKSWGIIEISFQTSANTQFEKVLGSHFKIKLDARKVFWTYYFVSNNENYFKNISVFLGKDKLNFSDEEQVILPNNQTATKITSQNTFSLSKFYGEEKIYAKLEDDGSVELRGGKMVNKIYLPTPDIQRIKAVVINGVTKYYSEMFIQNL